MRTCQCRPNTTSVELAPKTLADLHCKLFGNTEQKNFIYRKKILSASVCKKNCAMSAEKYQSGQFNHRCRVLFFQFNPWIIFGCCPLGNVRSASSGDAFYFRRRSIIYPGRHRLSFFFFINIGELCFFAELGQCVFSRVNENMPISAETQLRFRSREET